MCTGSKLNPAGFGRCKPWLDGGAHAADFTFSRIIRG
jgi:hypothetical protein